MFDATVADLNLVNFAGQPAGQEFLRISDIRKIRIFSL